MLPVRHREPFASSYSSQMRVKFQIMISSSSPRYVNVYEKKKILKVKGVHQTELGTQKKGKSGKSLQLKQDHCSSMISHWD